MEDRMTAQQLKNSILQMAVQGKLVPQDPNDEPASVLLDRIRKEKEQLIKDGKIKKNKKESYIFRGADNLHYEQIGKEVKCIEDELPFEIPDSWEWTRLGNIGEWKAGSTPSKSNMDYYKDGSIPWLLTGDLNDGIIEEIPNKITEKALNETSVKLNPSGSILIAMYGATIGKLGILTFPATTNQACCACNVFQPFYNLYLFYYLMANKVHFVKQGEGGAQPNISREKIVKTLIPVPPRNEQDRIVKKLKKLKPLIEKYKLAEEKLYKLNSDIKNQLKKSILQYAIEGKLVTQDPNDESASVLLEKIHTEKEKLIAEGKIKKDKNESIIYRRDNSYYEKLGKNEISIDELIPFDIPHNWTWTRLSSIANTLGGYAFKSAEYTNKGVRVIRISDFDNSGILDGEYKYYHEEESLNKYILKENDILLCMTGGTVGKTCINNRKTKQYLNQRVASIRTYDLIYYKYIYKVITSNYIQCIINKSKTSTNDNISMDTINNLLIPLPPYNEQVRICEIIDRI